MQLQASCCSSASILRQSAGYSTQRGFGTTHPFVGELRVGEVEVGLVPEELGFTVVLGTVLLTECELVNQCEGEGGRPPQFTRGYGLCFGHADRKAMSVALQGDRMNGR